MSQGYTFRRQASQAKMDRMLELLTAPMTRAELAERMHISVRSVQSYLKALLAESTRRIYVHDWRPNSPGSPSAVYLCGNRPDKRRPRRMTAAECSRKRRNDADVAIDHIQRQRLKRIKPKRDAMTSAFFGAAR